MPIPTYVDADLRIQFLSPTLVRIERKGPKGFENRPTFTAVGRDWTGIPFRKRGNRLVTAGYTVVVPPTRDGLKGIQIVVKGKPVYTVGDVPNKSWLPAPAETGPVYALADRPRMVPPRGGAIPRNIAGPYEATSGYDTGNDAPDIYLFVTKNAQQLRKDFLHLTGPIPKVPRYTFGYWDSRWYPYTESMALACIDEYRRHGLPLDLFVCDTDWRVGASKGYGVNTQLFPDMPRFLREAHAKGVRVMFNDHPEPQAPTALDPAETRYRWSGLTSLLGMGLDVWWFDRNWSTVLHEPMRGLNKETWGASVFQSVTQAFRPGKRPLIMANVDGIDNGARNRPPHPAFHRYPVDWTGDTTSTWRTLQNAVANGVDEGVLGLLPYVHEDAGGHMGNPAPELYTRFLQYAALSPVMRVHCTFGLNRYPWAYGPAAEQAVSEAIRFRYRLIPTLYTASMETHETGMPLLRRLDLFWSQFAEAAKNDQYLLGDDLLVAPVTKSDLPDLHPLAGNFRAEYFDNKNLEGAPVVTREESKIDNDWGGGSPANEIPSDNFSARWTGKIGPFDRAGDVKLATLTDDGSRLWVDGKLLIDQWKPQDSVTNVVKFHVEPGRTYDVKLEYFELSGGAVARLLWSGLAPKRQGPQNWSLWVPPGTWIDPWTGSRFVGPKTIASPAPLRKIPLLVRDGATFFLGDDRVKNSDEQMKRPVTVEMFPGERTNRRLIEDDGVSNDAPVDGWEAVSFRSPKGLQVLLAHTSPLNPSPREFVFRVHLRPGETARAVTLNGKSVAYRLEKPSGPAQGLDSIFAARGGAVVEIRTKLAGKHAAIEVRTQ